MGSLSTTRFENCRSIIANYSSIKMALEQEISQGRDKNAVEAIGLLTLIAKPDFVVSLFVFHLALKKINV